MCILLHGGGYHIARGNIHRKWYADRRVISFHRNANARIIVTLADIGNSSNLKLHVVLNLNGTNLLKDRVDSL